MYVCMSVCIYVYIYIYTYLQLDGKLPSGIPPRCGILFGPNDRRQLRQARQHRPRETQGRQESSR